MTYHLGNSLAAVARICWRWGRQPWNAETFRFSTDPNFGLHRGRVDAATRGMLWQTDIHFISDTLAAFADTKFH